MVIPEAGITARAPERQIPSLGLSGLTSCLLLTQSRASEALISSPSAWHMMPTRGSSSQRPGSVKPVLSLLINLFQSSLPAVMTKEPKIAQALQTLLEKAWA